MNWPFERYEECCACRGYVVVACWGCDKKFCLACMREHEATCK